MLNAPRAASSCGVFRATTVNLAANARRFCCFARSQVLCAAVRIVEPAEYKNRVKATFEARASTYDPRDTFHQDLAVRLVKLAEVTSDDEVLDLAAGTGMVALHAASTARAVTLLDLSPAMLEQAAVKAGQLGLRNCTFLAGDAETAQLPLAAFDLVTCSSAIIYFENIPSMLKAVHAWLKPGGRLVFNTPQLPCVAATLVFYRLLRQHCGVELLDAAEPLATREAVASALLEAGFETATVSTSEETMLARGKDATAYAEAMWATMAAGNAFQPLTGLVTQDQLGAFKGEFLSEVAASAVPWATAEGVRGPYTMLWAVARRSR